MMYTTHYTSDFADVSFQAAFRTYFEELGCRVTNWEGLFAAMGEAGRTYAWMHKDDAGCVNHFSSGMDANGRNHAFILRDSDDAVAGFIQFTEMHMDSWFFTSKCGFIREFWIRSDLRRQGNGAKLLCMAEEWLRHQGCICVLLTTDTAPGFYEKKGYVRQSGIEARNKDAVFVKLFV